ncbi:UNVERIFIED_CONTAM: hypothetical protein Sindi_1275200 [Sesamum indicum]
MRRFQVKPTQSWISSKVGGAPPRATAVHQPRRCLLPSRTTSVSSENLGNKASRQQVSDAPDTGFFAGKDVPLLPPASGATGRNALATVELPRDADVSNPSQAGAELENRVAKDVEGNDIIADVTSAAIVDLLIDDVTADSADVSSDVSFRNSLKKMLPSLANHASTGLFIGNIPLHEHGNSVIDNKITQDFNNSSRKTLSYIAPLTQNGEVVVRPSLHTVRDGAKGWKTTAVGYFLGKRPYYHHLKEYAHSVWPDLREVTATANGFFFFQFKNVIAMEEVIEGGPWLFQGQPIVLQKWEPDMAMRKQKHTQIPIWIKLRHLPMEYWTTEGLSTVASGVGKPLYPDAITRACTKLDFARVCVILDVTQKLINHVIIMTPNEDGGKTSCKIDVEYEWLPSKCMSCMMIGHMTKDCAMNKPLKSTKPPVAVYVPKAIIPQTQLANETKASNNDKMRAGTSINEEKQNDRGTTVPSRGGGLKAIREEKGKEIVVYNTFDAIHLIDDADDIAWAIWNVRGLNKRDHQQAVKDIVAEFRLQFLGLLETRVSINNAAQIQSFLLPNWKWYVDYGSSGNRVWIAWDDNFIDVEVVDCGMQFIHCLINIRAIHELVAVTVAYGATEVVDRRELWSALENIAIQCADILWLIGVDFNSVRDLSEVCGTLGDIRIAMEDFNATIQNTGLLPVPMQGEWYTWHNHSATPGNLWKRLDRMLINDRWMARFPNTFYLVLTPRTSDHSPMVIYGDRQQQYGGMFRFDNYLARSPEFIPSAEYMAT